MSHVVKNKSTAEGKAFWEHVETIAAQVRARREPSVTPIPPIPGDRLEQLANDPMMCNISPEVKLCMQELIEARQRIAKLTAANEELERENTRLKAPVSDEEWPKRYLRGKLAFRPTISRADVGALLASRAIKEGQ